MRLHFRGKDYEGPHTEWQVDEAEVGGVYRGSPWKVHRLAEQHRRRAKTTELQYRGVKYVK